MKLDLGGGQGAQPRDFQSVDLYFGAHIWDLSQFPYPFEDNSVQVIHSSHTLEHLSKKNAIRCIQECYRILQPGGIITLAVPDMDIFVEAHLTGDWSLVPDHCCRDLNLCLGDGVHPDNPWRHKTMFCFESLAYILQQAGFVDLVRHGFHDSPHRMHFEDAYNPDYKHCSLYVDAIKPG